MSFVVSAPSSKTKATSSSYSLYRTIIYFTERLTAFWSVVGDRNEDRQPKLIIVIITSHGLSAR